MPSSRVSWFARTKLMPPAAPADLLVRPELSARLLAAAKAARLTLVSAAAGAGKTTALAALARDLAPAPVAWLSLDEDDNDPTAFFPALVAALRQALPGMGHDAEAVLASPAAQPPRRLVSVLINDILDGATLPAALVLDDLHTITNPALLGALDYLLERSPEGFHVVAGARYEPGLALARLRTRGQLAEFTTADLLLAPAELRAWFIQAFAIDLPDAEAARIHARIDGWIAGARLLALSLPREPGDAGRLIATPPEQERELFEYLAAEVLDAQDAATRAFLLETSILPELTAALCGAVTGSDDAARTLDRLHRKNLFIERLPGQEGASGPSYRYHALFALFLRRQLGQELPDRVAGLHLRAAAAEASPARAVRHYLAAGAPERAAATIARAASTATVGDLAPLRRLLDELPQALRTSHPWLAQLAGADLARKGRYEEARPLLEQALAGFEAAADRHGAGHARVYLGEVFTCLGDAANARPALDASLAADLTFDQRVTSELNLAWIAYYDRDWAAVESRLGQLLSRAEAEPGLPLLEGMVLSLGPQFAFTGAGHERLAALCDRAIALAGHGIGPAQAGAHAYRGYLRFLDGSLEEATRDATIAAGMCEDLGGFAHLELFTDHVLLFAALADGDFASFDGIIARALDRSATRTTHRQWLAAYLYIQGRAAWLRGDTVGVVEASERLRATKVPHELPDAETPRQLLEALGALVAGKHGEAIGHFRAAAAAQELTRHALLATSARLGLAVQLFALGDREHALQELAAALEFIERNNAAGLILQEGAPVIPVLAAAERAGMLARSAATSLAMLRRPEGPPRLPAAGLSRREVEILGLLAEGATNQEIADRLVIALGTAKRHTINIYTKLGAANRTQAVALARARGILSGPRV